MEVQIPLMLSPRTARKRIQDLEQQLKEQRASITLLKQPINTLRLFLGAVLDCVVQGCVYASRHPVVVYCLAPAMLLWIVLECFPGFHTAAINRVEFTVQVRCGGGHTVAGMVFVVILRFVAALAVHSSSSGGSASECCLRSAWARASTRACCSCFHTS